ncbi:MAG: thioredoxin family protein [Lentisphaerae bacterium]|nr:thioredoxin family protein [Lentisphaerota bacterium]
MRSIPHLFFFDKDGKQIHTHTGYMPKEQIEEWLAKCGVAL